MALKYRLAEKTIGDDDLADLVAWLKTGPWLTQGPLVREFEARWAEWVGTKHAVFVNSGSSANLLAYYAALVSGRLRNKKVIVPAVSWATTVAPAVQFGLTPIPCDAEPRALGLDPGRLEALVKKHQPGAVVVVHVLGVPAELDAILALRAKHGFLLIEDACAATGSRYGDRRVGSFGDMGTFSFFYGHHMSTIEGGMVCTDSPALRELLVQLRAHGWAKDLPAESERRLSRARKVIDFNRPFTFYQPGFNVRSTDLNARIGLSQLRKIDRVVARRAENHRLYQELTAAAPGFSCQSNPRAEISSISFAALASSEAHRERVADALREAGVETRPLGGGNMTRQPFWSDRLPPAELPVADRVHSCCFHLPNHPGLSAQDIRAICRAAFAVEAGDGKRRRRAA